MNICIKTVRKRKKMKQKELAKQLGVSVNSLYRWEQNIVSPSLKNKEKSIKVSSVKKETFVQKCLDITSDNNIDIQIYHNINDIKNILSRYCNDVVYAISAIAKKDDYNSGSSNSDIVGMLRSDLTKKENNKTQELMCCINIDSLHKALRSFGIIDSEDVDEDLIFEFLRLFSAIRQYCVHNQQFKLSDNEASKKLYEIADKKIETFEKEFTKINKKNLLVLEDFCSKYSNRYKYEDIQNTYYKYVSFDEGKNIGISVDKLAKLIKEKQANFIVDPNKGAEFKNKYKQLLNFFVYL